MVKGSTIQLISKGQQDLYLTGTPKITFWKSVYRRHTQFAIESIRNNFNTKPAFGETIVSEIKRSGDLLNKMYLVLTLPKLNTNEIFREDPNSAYHPNNATVLPGVMSYTQAAWTEHVGNALVDEVKLIINDSVIDHQYGVWFDIWQELTNRTYQKAALDKMLGTQKKSELPYNASKEQILYIPLQFWFNRNIGLSLPLVALTYASVKISIKLRKLKDLIIAVSKKEYVPDNLTEWPNDNSTPETGIYNLSLAMLRGKYKQLKVSTPLGTYTGSGDSATVNRFTYTITYPIPGIPELAAGSIIRLGMTSNINNDNDPLTYGTIPPGITITNQTVDNRWIVIEVKTDTETNAPLVTYTLTLARWSFAKNNYTNANYTINTDNEWDLQIWPPMMSLVPGERVKPLLSQNNLLYLEPDVQIKNCHLAVDYVFLSKEETRIFTDNTHEYLIEQLQMNKVSFGKLETREVGKQILLNFKHPVKELVWILQDEQNIATSGYYQNNWFNYGFNDGGLVISTDAVLGTNGTKWDGKNHDFLSTSQESGIVINTHERFPRRRRNYFRYTQPQQHHTCVSKKSIYMYSFSIRPEEHQPSGTLNFSRLSDVRAKFFMSKVSPIDLRLGTLINMTMFATSYNIFKIEQGLGGILYEN